MNIFKLTSLLVLLLLSNSIYSQENKEYTASWESVESHPFPQWFSEAKLGIFIHWGVYSVPSWAGKEQYAEWYLRGLQKNDSARIAFQEKYYGENWKYKDFAPLFKTELFDAEEWADIFKRSGAKYVTLVAKHHDGYCLWPSKYAKNWNSLDVGPKRDLVGELSSAVKKSGMKMGLYYSLTEWNNPLHRWYTDPNDSIGRYVKQHMIPQFKELIGKYKPSLIFADGEWFNHADDFHTPELLSWYYNLVGSEAIVNNRWGHGSSNVGFLTPEYSAGLNITDRPWTEVRGLGRSFGLNRNEKVEAYMTSEELVQLLVKSVAHGGGLLINVGPGADGRIPLLQQDRLLNLGKWLETNGEAIYGSKTWIRQAEEKDVYIKRIDSEINFNWVRNSPGKPLSEDLFSAKWTGFISVPTDGKYIIEAEADDAIRIWLDDELIVNKWNDKNSETPSGNVMSNHDYTIEKAELNLVSGKKYAIKIEYQEELLNARAKLFWSSDKIEKQIIPQDYLFSEKKMEKGNGLNAIYKSKAIWLCYTQNNDNLYITMFDWPGNKLIIDFPKPKGKLDISFLGSDNNIDYKYKKAKLHIDLSKVKIQDLTSKYAWTIKVSGI